MAIGIGVAVVLLGLGVAIATRPDSFRIERRATLAAPAEVIFGYVNDFHRWAEWSPWEKLDPNLKRIFEGPSTGVGASYAWEGNAKAGQGKMTMRESQPNERIAIELHFIKPFEAEHLAEFAFRPSASGVEVTWSMSGKNKFMSKAFAFFFDQDKLIGKDFEQGLAKLGAVAASEAQARLAPSVAVT